MSGCNQLNKGAAFERLSSLKTTRIRNTGGSIRMKLLPCLAIVIVLPIFATALRAGETRKT